MNVELPNGDVGRLAEAKIIGKGTLLNGLILHFRLRKWLYISDRGA